MRVVRPELLAATPPIRCSPGSTLQEAPNLLASGTATAQQPPVAQPAETGPGQAPQDQD
jgi:hypothetical protein